MWDDALETALGLLWEVLSAEAAPVSSEVLKKKTGLPMGRIYAGLKKMSDAGLLHEGNVTADQWLSKKELDALSWARAVETGVPLHTLEKTVSLSAANRKKAEQMASSGQIDKEARRRQANKARERDKTLRGRAASRAATTDLARIVQDTQDALRPGSADNEVRNAIRQEAQKALEALVKALERG